jgi:hypothetical protein
MNKSLTTGELRVIGADLLKGWEASKNEIKLSGKNLHSLIALKKIIERELTIIEETVMGLAVQYDAVPNPDGSATIPEPRRKEAFEALNEFAKETIDIEYKEVVIGEDDNVPIDILEALFEFIRFEEE